MTVRIKQKMSIHVKKRVSDSIFIDTLIRTRVTTQNDSIGEKNVQKSDIYKNTLFIRVSKQSAPIVINLRERVCQITLVRQTEIENFRRLLSVA